MHITRNENKSIRKTSFVTYVAMSIENQKSKMFSKEKYYCLVHLLQSNDFCCHLHVWCIVSILPNLRLVTDTINHIQSDEDY